MPLLDYQDGLLHISRLSASGRVDAVGARVSDGPIRYGCVFFEGTLFFILTGNHKENRMFLWVSLKQIPQTHSTFVNFRGCGVTRRHCLGQGTGWFCEVGGFSRLEVVEVKEEEGKFSSCLNVYWFYLPIIFLRFGHEVRGAKGWRGPGPRKPPGPNRLVGSRSLRLVHRDAFRQTAAAARVRESRNQIPSASEPSRQAVWYLAVGQMPNRFAPSEHPIQSPPK